MCVFCRLLTCVFFFYDLASTDCLRAVAGWPTKTRLLFFTQLAKIEKKNAFQRFVYNLPNFFFTTSSRPLCFQPPSSKVLRISFLYSSIDTKTIVFSSLTVGTAVLAGAAGGEFRVPRLPEDVGVHLPRREPESRVPAVLQERPMMMICRRID